MSDLGQYRGALNYQDEHFEEVVAIDSSRRQARVHIGSAAGKIN
jgi:hypothetical protein